MNFLRILCLVCLVVSCSSDDSTNTSDPIVVEGLYSLTAANTTPSTDLNADGTPSMNQMDETNCYSNMQISFNGFGDFTAVFKKVVLGTATDINTGEVTIIADCETTLAQGAYALSGDQLTLSYDLNGSQVTEVYTASPNTIRRTLTNQQLVNSIAGGGFENINGDLLLVFANN